MPLVWMGCTDYCRWRRARRRRRRVCAVCHDACHAAAGLV